MRPSFGTNLPQIVTHIWQKAFFKYALEEKLLYIKRYIVPEYFGTYAGEMRNYALIANGIMYA